MTSTILFPQGRFSLKLIKGVLLVEVGKSSGRNFSMSFFREVACFDFEALKQFVIFQKLSFHLFLY